MTTLNVNLSQKLQTDLGTPGVWAYAVYYDSSGKNPTWTQIVDDGSVTGSVAIALPASFVGGKVYFIVQSESPSQPIDLETKLTTESTLNWANAATYDFRYDSFEVTLQNQPAEAGNLSSVNGFGLPMEISVPYVSGTTATVG